MTAVGGFIVAFLVGHFLMTTLQRWRMRRRIEAVRREIEQVTREMRAAGLLVVDTSMVLSDDESGSRNRVYWQ